MGLNQYNWFNFGIFKKCFKEDKSETEVVEENLEADTATSSKTKEALPIRIQKFFISIRTAKAKSPKAKTEQTVKNPKDKSDEIDDQKLQEDASFIEKVRTKMNGLLNKNTDQDSNDIQNTDTEPKPDKN